ncbi:MAG: EAL domain-containing protein [Pseudolabrys sp.]|nr:EAL domain-containing protein [Pseudolabrys sp.]MDP2298527.1 EAL domain-containing protein [Pseudolabrys sp.]
MPTTLLGIRFFQNRAAEIDAALARQASLASNIANDLDEKIQGTAQLQFGLARAIDLDSADRAECSAFLSAVREAYAQYTGILTIAPNGRLFCDSLQTNRELDLNDRDYFKKAVGTSDIVTLQPAVGRLTGMSVLQIAYPARTPAGALKYVLLASFNLQKFVDHHIEQLSGTVKILLVDKAGTVLVAPHTQTWTKPVGTSIAGTDLFQLAVGQSGGQAREVTGFEGRRQFWAAADTPAVRDAGLYVLVGMPRDGLVAAANNRLYEDFAIVGIVALLLFAGVWTLAEIGIRRQVGRIAAMAKKLGAGDLGVRIAAPYPGGELGQLMNELNATASSLQQQHAAIDDLNRKLRQSQQVEARTKVFLDTVIDHIPNAVSVKVPNAPGRDSSDWRLTLVNKAYETLAGRTRDQLIGKSAREIYSSETADYIITSDAHALNSPAAVITPEFPTTMEIGERIVTSKRVAIRDADGVPQYVLTVLEDITAKRRSEERISYMAHYDTLTDLPNRAAFNAFFATTIAQAAKKGESFTILSIDLDRFKETNDVYGHAAGDVLLQEVARRLRNAAAGAFVARIGGDEFTLVVTGGIHPAAALAVADELLAAFVDDFMIGGKRFQIGLSIGGAVYPHDGIDAKTLMVNADAALYRAKAEPRACVRFFQPEMGAQLQQRHDLQLDLKSAIDRGGLSLHYQPQFRITGEVVGFEALARWQSPTRGMVPPSTFIPIAEEYSLIIPLGEWALREACSEAASWEKPLSIAVNVSPIQFHHGDLPSLVHEILLETGLPPARLELEITEGVLINDFSRALAILCKLKALGVRIALDDFGKGYSSLSYLHSFPFDKIKIDRAFVADLEHNHHSMAIVRAVIGLGHSLKIPILAEGVETASQRAFLLQAGCDEIQGYLTGRPYPMADYAELVGRPSIYRKDARRTAVDQSPPVKRAVGQAQPFPRKVGPV